MRFFLLFAPFHLANLHKYLIFTFTCMVKYLVGIVYAKADGLNFYETATFGALGGVLGVIFFAYFGAAIQKYYLSHRKEKKKPINFRRAKRIRTFWHKYGLIGISIIAPLISPMVAVPIALAFREEPRRIIPLMAISFVIWSVLLAFVLNLGSLFG